MGSVQRRERERQATRELILGAARDLFLKEGFEAVSMRRIAQAIEYTPAAIYTHFADKQALLMALGETDFRLLRESMREVDHIEDPVERLRAGGLAYIHFALDHPHHYRLMFMTRWPQMDPAQCPIEHGNADQDAFACLEQVVGECIRTGRFKPAYRDPQVVTQLCWAAVHGVVSLFITHGDDPWVDFKSPLETARKLLAASIDGMLIQDSPAQKPAPRRKAKS
jgi:AcrR family transcriptional regulator